MGYCSTMNEKIGLAGDWHGAIQWQKHALYTLGEAGVKTVLHAGDFSLGWPGVWPHLIDSAEAVCRRYDMQLLITPGNHENWEWINTREFDDGGFHWMTNHTAILRRNTVFQLGGRSVLSLGGANSIDYPFRTQGIDWWKEEAISYADVIECRRIGAQNDIDIMVCHDSPDGGAEPVEFIIQNPDPTMWSQAGLTYAGEGRAVMNHAFSGVNPKVFVHGHFHAAGITQRPETLFVSLGCNNQANNLALLDPDSLEVEWLPIMQDIREVETRKKAEDSERRNAQRGA